MRTIGMRFGMAGLLVLLTALPAAADTETCGKAQTLVRIEEKECPARPNRPAFIVKRACCKNPAGRTHCNHMPHCPAVSPS